MEPALTLFDSNSSIAINVRETRSHSDAASPSKAEIEVKLARLFSRHEEMKIAYHRLQSQIKFGLAEAKEVFTSLAVPLMKLVGLKTEEMAGEGRSNTFIFDADSFPISGARGGDRGDQIRKTEAKSYAAKASIARRKFLDRQQKQLLQLVCLLKNIENQVNSHQDNILQNLAHQRTFLVRLFQEAVCRISAYHGQSHDTSGITLKLLQAIFSTTTTILSSVENGVQDLMESLAVQMCSPMVRYVMGQKSDLSIGTSAQFVAFVEEMEREVVDGQVELEEAQKRIRVAEEGKFEALCKLKQMEERMRRMSGYLGYLCDKQNGQTKRLVHNKKFLGMEENHTSLNSQPWELNRNKRKYRVPESPAGPQQLMFFEPHGKNRRSYGISSTLDQVQGPVTRTGTCNRGFSPQTPLFDARGLLGSSPTVALQKFALL